MIKIVNHIFHISNTDIISDSRIRKEIVAIGSIEGVVNSVIGLAGDGSVGTQGLDGANYFKSPLTSRAMKHLPRPIRYFFELIEFTIRATIFAGSSQPKPAVVHCHDTFALPAGWLIKKIFGSRLVYDAHELESNKNGQSKVLSKATFLIEKFCWRQIDLLVSVSDSIIGWYFENLGKKASVLVLNSPVYDPRAVKKKTNRQENYFVKKYKIPEESLIFVYLGILTPGRGIEACIDAFQEIGDDAHVVFIGFGKMENQIKHISQNQNNIHFHPPVKHHEVVPLVSSADYGLCLVEDVSLSDYLCLPNKLFEYSFAGLRILGSNFPEIEKTVTQFDLGVCCPPNSKSIKMAVSSIIDFPSQNTAKDLSELSWSVQATRLQEAYKTLLRTAKSVQ